MWNNAGLSTSILITTYSPANGMVHHTVAKIFVSTKLRDLGPKSSATRTFWRMVATCIRYEPPTEHLLWDLTTFNLASIKAPCAGTSFLGLAHPSYPPNSLDDTPDLPQILPIYPNDYSGIDSFMLAMITPLPPVGILERIVLSLKEGESLSESTLRRLRRRDAEIRAATAEGRSPLSEHKRRKLKQLAARASAPQASLEISPEKATLASQGLDPPPATGSYSRPKAPHQRATIKFVGAINLLRSELRKVSVEDVEKLAASFSVYQRSDSQGAQPTAPPSDTHMSDPLLKI